MRHRLLVGMLALSSIRIARSRPAVALWLPQRTYNVEKKDELEKERPGRIQKSIQKHLKGHVAHPKLMNPRANIPKELNDLVMQCLARDPNKRPQSTQGLCAQLESILKQSNRISQTIAPLFTPPPMGEDVLSSTNQKKSSDFFVCFLKSHEYMREDVHD